MADEPRALDVLTTVAVDDDFFAWASLNFRAAVGLFDLQLDRVSSVFFLLVALNVNFALFRQRLHDLDELLVGQTVVFIEAELFLVLPPRFAVAVFLQQR